MAIISDAYRNPKIPQKSSGALNPRTTAMKAATTASAPTTAPAPAPAPAPSGGGTGGGSYDTYSGGGSYGGGGFGGGGGGIAPMIAAPTEEDYLAGDSGFQTQQSALQAALQRFLADADFQRSNYNADYGRSLKDLGYDEGQKAWNWNDKLTASGRGYQNQLDDFGNRGMLQSSGYADAFEELKRMLNQQYEGVSNAKNTWMTDMDNQTANFKAENTANAQAARAEALARRAASFGL